MSLPAALMQKTALASSCAYPEKLWGERVFSLKLLPIKFPSKSARLLHFAPLFA